MRMCCLHACSCRMHAVASGAVLHELPAVNASSGSCRMQQVLVCQLVRGKPECCGAAAVAASFRWPAISCSIHTSVCHRKLPPSVPPQAAALGALRALAAAADADASTAALPPQLHCHHSCTATTASWPLPIVAMLCTAFNVSPVGLLRAG
jgi:hypothetical protein